MAVLCPVRNTPEEMAKWNKLVDLSGSPEAAYRAFHRFAHTTSPVDEALSRFDIGKFKIEDKIKALQAVSAKITRRDSLDPNTGEPIHEYFDIGTGKLLLSVSRVLDQHPATAYRGKSAGTQYSDKGTVVHKAFENYIEWTDPARPDPSARANMLEFLKNSGIPASFLSTIESTVAHLRSQGKVLSEMRLAELNLGFAGTGDIYLLKYDGTIDIYDIKTAHRTANTPAEGKLWDPVGHHNGYKAVRYTAQMEFYGRMVERILGQPVKNKYIIPIEVSYKNNDTTQGFENLVALPLDNVEKYNATDTAEEIVSKFFHDNKADMELPKLLTVDDSGDLLRSISGKLEGRISDMDKDADDILDNPQHHYIVQGVKYYHNPLKTGSKWVRLIGDRQAQKRQIIDEYLSLVSNARENIDESIRNKIVTGRDEFLDSPDFSAGVKIKQSLDLYTGRNNVKVTKLTDIQGFDNKKGWILIEDGDIKNGGTYDLLYFGKDNLDEVINVSKKIKGGDTLFARHMSEREASLQLKSDLRNTVGDLRKLEAGLIMMKLKEASPEATFRRAVIHSTHSTNYKPRAADVYTLLPTIQALGKMKPDLIPTNMKSIFKDSRFFDPRNYSYNSATPVQTAAQAYIDFLGLYQHTRDNRMFTPEDVKGYLEDKSGLEQLAYSALKESTEMAKRGLNEPVHLEERRLLRNIYYSLEKIGQELHPIGFLNGKISMPQNMPVDVMQDVVKKMAGALERIRTNFWDKYKVPTEKYFNNLFAPLYTLSGARDLVMSDTERYYEPILAKVKKRVRTGISDNGEITTEEQDVYSYNLVQEGSDAFKQLSPAQQEFIVMFNDKVQEAMGLMGIEWQRGRMPLVHGSYRNQFYRAMKLGGHSTMSHYKEALKNAFRGFEEDLSDAARPDSEFTIGTSNPFYSQRNGESYDERSSMMGLEDDIVDPDKHGVWETNLEIVLDLVMMTAYRGPEMAMMNNVILAARDHFNWQKSNLFEERLDANITWLKDYRTYNVESKDTDTGTVQNKVVRSLNKVSSIGILGLNMGVALGSTVGQQMVAASRAVTGGFVKNGRYNAKDWTKATALVMNPLNWKKTTALLRQYGLYESDVTSMMSGTHRYGNKSLFRMKWLFAPFRAGDWLSRSNILVANLVKDGLWDAYSVDADGNLTFDSSKDKRDPLLIEAVKANMMKDNPEFIVDGKLTRAYDFNIRNSIHSQINMTLGGYDREARGMYNAYAVGKLFGLFKTFLPSRVDALTSPTFNSRMTGKYELTEVDGKKQYVWTGDPVEGVYHSLNMMMLYLKKRGQEDAPELSSTAKTNLLTMTGDLLTALAIFSAIGFYEAGDDDKDQLDSLAGYIANAIIRDTLAFYNVLAFAEFLSTPVAIDFARRLGAKAYRVFTNIPNEDADTIVDAISLHPAAADYLEVIDYLYDEPSN